MSMGGMMFQDMELLHLPFLVGITGKWPAVYLSP